MKNINEIFNEYNQFDETTKQYFDEYRDRAKKVLNRETPKQYIKQREGGGGVTLDYVEGSYVIRALNEAFNNMWDWEIIDFKIINSVPKKITKEYNKAQRRLVELDEPRYEEQPPVAHVVGKLTAPGFGSRVGFGSKTIIGGASEQESCFKAAATDALKKAATLFGIALDLYEDIPYQLQEEDEEKEVIKSSRGNKEEYMQKITSQAQPTVTHNNNAEEENEQEEFDPSDIIKLKQLANELGVGSNKSLLNPYVKEFDENLDSIDDITPKNIKQFVTYLEHVVLGK